MRVVTRNELNALGCNMPGCDHKDHNVMFLHPNCHAYAGTWASYDKTTDTLTIRCRACERAFVEILVGDDRNHADERRPSPWAEQGG
jgi:hypothetical protein